jgi:HD-like signal output (HDOD) protein
MIAAKAIAPFRIDKNFDMPTVPLVLSRIIQVLDDDHSSAQEMEELILHDPSLSARILKLANSALYSFRSEVKTISHAIPLLGLNLVKSLAIGVSVFESFTKGAKGESAHISNLWMHSFGVGMLSPGDLEEKGHAQGSGIRVPVRTAPRPGQGDLLQKGPDALQLHLRSGTER